MGEEGREGWRRRDANILYKPPYGSCLNCGTETTRPCPRWEQCYIIYYDHEGWPSERYFKDWQPRGD